MSPGQDSGLDGRLLRELREESGFTLRDLSEKTGLIGGQRQTLGPGDAIQYDGSQPHKIWNRGDEPLRFVSALTPPTL